MARKTTATETSHLTPIYGEVEMEFPVYATYERAKIDVMGTSAVLTIMEAPPSSEELEEDRKNRRAPRIPRPRRIDRLTKCRMLTNGDGTVEYIGVSDYLRSTVGTADAETRWVVTPKACADCG